MPLLPPFCSDCNKTNHDRRLRGAASGSLGPPLPPECSIHGRAQDLADLKALLDRHGSVAIVGPPGMGKTTLATALEPALVVDLEGATDAPGLQSAMARALDTPVDRPAAVDAALAGHPRVLLDGTEHCDAALVERLPTWLERTSIVLTSRRRPAADLPVFELGPLDDAAGAALIRERVRSARQASALEEADLQALSRALDGIPLALELAASRLRLYAPRDLLDHGVDALSAPERPPRQRLLDGIRASLDALDAEARGLLAVAAFLPGPFPTERLALAAGRPVDAALLTLLDSSLVHPIPAVPPRFRVLAPIRAVALESLDGPGRQAVLGRLAGPVLAESEALVADLEGPLHPETPGRLAALVPPLELLLGTDDATVRARAALALAARERHTGPQSTTVRRDRTLDLSAAPPALQIRWALAVVRSACHLGQPAEAAAPLARVEPLLTDGDRVAWLSMRSVWRLCRGELEAALADATEATALDRGPWSAFRLGSVQFRMGDFEAAIAAFRRAREVDSAFRRAQATNALCICLRETGHPPDRVLAELAWVDNPTDLATHTWLVPRFGTLRGVLHTDLGELDEAREALFQAVDQLRALGEPDAVVPWLNATVLDLLEGTVPTAIFDPPEAPPHFTPVLDGWAAICLALLDRPEATTAGPAALATLAEQRHRQHHELAAAFALAIAPARRDLAEAALAGLPEDDPCLQLARQLLDGAEPSPRPRIEDRMLLAIARRTAARIRIDPDGSGFTGADGQRVDLSRKRVLRRMLLALLEADRPLDVAALCARVWPGESLVGDSGTRRVHVAISSLRGLGLRPLIRTETDDEGVTRWVLDGRDG